MNPLRPVALFLIRVYQYCISPLMPSHCRFVPSCSAYAYEAVIRHGVFKGSLLTLRRLARCHPLCKGGWDPVPPVLPQPKPH